MFELTLDKIDGLDAGVKNFYTEKDGKYHLNPVVAGLQTEVSAIRGKNEELLNETKTAKQLRKDAEAAAQVAAEEALKKNGNYKELHESAMKQLAQEREGRTRLERTVSTEKKEAAALKIAVDLADGANVELLSEFIARRLDHVDGGLKVLDRDGKLTISSLDDLKKEFQNDPKYSSLVKGRKASGGGAGGGEKGGSAAKEMPRSEFNKLDPSDRSKFCASGGIPI